MKPCSREIQRINSLFNPDFPTDQTQISSSHHHPPLHLFHSSSSSSDDDFLAQILSTLPSSSSWPDLNSPWDLNPSDSSSSTAINKLGDLSYETPPSNLDAIGFQLEDSVSLASKLRNHQISSSSSAEKASMILQQQLLMSRPEASNSGLPPMPLSSSDDIFDGPSSFKTPILGGSNQGRSFLAPGSLSTGSGGSLPAHSRQKVRARRGQATDPHSIAERIRRERIAERMKSLQELVPNGNKTDKASMLDEIIDYVKFLQLQVKVLSMSRLGGTTPIIADISEPKQTTSSNESLSVTENQVVKLMEKDMGSAMQYLQGKGLCLMPISLATVISTTTSHSSNPLINHLLPSSGDGPSSSSSMSGLTVQSTAFGTNDSYVSKY